MESNSNHYVLISYEWLILPNLPRILQRHWTRHYRTCKRNHQAGMDIQNETLQGLERGKGTNR